MGKGDPRTKRGKIFKGTFGKSRPRLKKKRKQLQAQAQETHPQS